MSDKKSAAKPAPHAIVKLALAALEKGAKEPYLLGRDGRMRLLAALKAKAKASDLKKAVADLVGLAAYLDERKKSPKAAQALLEVAASAIPALKASPKPKTR